MAAAVFRRSIDFRGPADLDLVIADKRPADERRARMAAAIAAMTKGIMLHCGDHRIANFAAMASTAGTGGFLGHRSLLGIRPEHIINMLDGNRSEEQTSEIQSIMRISYDVYSVNKTKQNIQ